MQDLKYSAPNQNQQPFSFSSFFSGFFNNSTDSSSEEGELVKPIVDLLERWEKLNAELINLLDTTLHPNDSKTLITSAIYLVGGGIISIALGCGAQYGVFNQAIDPTIAIIVGVSMWILAALALILEGWFPDKLASEKLGSAQAKISDQVKKLWEEIQGVVETLNCYGVNDIAAVDTSQTEELDTLNVGDIVTRRTELLQQIGFNVSEISAGYSQSR